MEVFVTCPRECCVKEEKKGVRRGGGVADEMLCWRFFEARAS